MSKIGCFSFLSMLLSFFSQAQPCHFQLTGQVIDKSTGIPLGYANLYLEEQEQGTVSDSAGFFQLKDLCAGAYHLEISHIGCESEHQFITLSQDTFLTISLHHHAELLDEVVVHGKKDDHSAQASSTVSRENIEQNSHKNLSDILESLTGVSTLKNGSGISKPVVHGLSGNRVAILNNGIAQAGQQWGNDHAPEIDPFVADHLSVIKGASALAYGGNSLGSVVLVEAAKIRKDPHLHGGINYILQTNGWGNTLNAQLEKNETWAAWRISGTLKMQGDPKTPDYFLTNTGKREGNIAFQLEKEIGDHWHNELYFSSFNTKIGVLRGSHISNLTDLEAAIGREVPFFTKDNFSYQIEAPHQQVNHHLIKLTSKYFLNDHQVFHFKYGGQLNDRKEFDVRRGGKSDLPALSLQQFSHFLEAGFQQDLEQGLFLKMGLQYQLVDNANNPETGILPLIPNYESHQTTAFFIIQKEHKKWLYEAGGRYELKQMNVVAISKTLPRRIEHFDHTFHNYAFSVGAKYEIIEGLKTNWNLGYMLRAPEVNELYSSGLHQGVSGIEEGIRSLAAEKSLKLVGTLDWYFRQKMFVQALVYFQDIQDYIYLQPQNEFRLTIRGAFPVFIYQQTHARLSGVDFLYSFEPRKNLKWVVKYAKVEGKDRRNRTALLNIPSDNLFSSLTWSLKEGNSFKNNQFSISGKYIFQQKDLLPEQDFLFPPDAYFLLGLSLSSTVQLPHSKLKLSLSVENLLNATYRDYLNRLRYFADDLGTNILLNLNYKF